MLTKTEEYHLILLTALIDLGGSGEKLKTCAQIEHADYFKFDPRDRLSREVNGGGDLIWINDFAFNRKGLALMNCLEGRGINLIEAGHNHPLYNNWKLTDAGYAYFRILAKDAIDGGEFVKLTDKLVERCEELLSDPVFTAGSSPDSSAAIVRDVKLHHKGDGAYEVSDGGSIGNGARVYHRTLGTGKVVFIREGFPKVKVRFNSTEEKVDRSELFIRPVEAVN